MRAPPRQPLSTEGTRRANLHISLALGLVAPNAQTLHLAGVFFSPEWFRTSPVPWDDLASLSLNFLICEMNYEQMLSERGRAAASKEHRLQDWAAKAKSWPGHTLAVLLWAGLSISLFLHM